MRHKQHAIYYTTKPIDAKDSFWITAPREGYSNRCYSEWERRMKGTRFDRERHNLTLDNSGGSAYRNNAYWNKADAVQHSRMKQGFVLMRAE